MTTKPRHSIKSTKLNRNIPPVEAGAKAAAEAIRDAQITAFMITILMMVQLVVLA
jgi:hypothetical protein